MFNVNIYERKKMKHTDLVGSDYGAAVVPYYSCIQPLDALKLMKHTGLVIPKKLQLKVNYRRIKIRV